MYGYQSDLAYIHDAGFGGFARKAAPGLLAILGRARILSGRVVDLGCGSGIWAAELTRRGYEVVGIDISRSMLELVRERAPAARFVNASFLTAKLPPCDAFTAIGECFNYTFDGFTSAGLVSSTELPKLKHCCRTPRCGLCRPRAACLWMHAFAVSQRRVRGNETPAHVNSGDAWTSSTVSTRSAKH